MFNRTSRAPYKVRMNGIFGSKRVELKCNQTVFAHGSNYYCFNPHLNPRKCYFLLMFPFYSNHLMVGRWKISRCCPLAPQATALFITTWLQKTPMCLVSLHSFFSFSENFFLITYFSISIIFWMFLFRPWQTPAMNSRQDIICVGSRALWNFWFEKYFNNLNTLKWNFKTN